MTVYRSPYPDIDIPSTALAEFVLAGARERGDRPALVDGVTGRTIRYAELPDLVAAGARGGERAPAQIVRQVGLEPAADFLAKRFFAVGEVEVHWEKGAPPPSRLPRVHARRRHAAIFWETGAPPPSRLPRGDAGWQRDA